MSTEDTRTDAIGCRELGTGGPSVSELGLGCIGMTGFYGDADQDEAVRTLHRALDHGCTFWDSSDAYGPHTNEQLLGRLLAERRDEVFVATKFGIKLDVETMQRSVDGKPETVRTSCEGSLRRLGVDHIDLYFQHRVDPVTPIEDTVGAMAELVQQGKVRYLGLCEAGPDTIRRAHAVHPLSAVQTEYSLWSRGVEREVLPTLRALGIGLIAYAPLSRGFLTGQYSGPKDLAPIDIRRHQPRFAAENLDHNVRGRILGARWTRRESLRLCSRSATLCGWITTVRPSTLHPGGPHLPWDGGHRRGGHRTRRGPSRHRAGSSGRLAPSPRRAKRRQNRLPVRSCSGEHGEAGATKRLRARSTARTRSPVSSPATSILTTARSGTPLPHWSPNLRTPKIPTR